MSACDPKRTCKCMLNSALKIRRIGEGPGRSGPCSFRYMRWLNVVVTENMKHCLAICDQVVRYNLAMAPPPYRFRTT